MTTLPWSPFCVASAALPNLGNNPIAATAAVTTFPTLAMELLPQAAVGTSFFILMSRRLFRLFPRLLGL